MHTSKFRFILLLSIALALYFDAVEAESLLTRVEGIVTDAVSGQPVENARVQLGDGEYVCLTNASGRFFFFAVPAGEWKLDVSRMGYKSSGGVQITLVEDLARPLQIRLEPQPIILPGQRVSGTKAPEIGPVQPDVVLTMDEINRAGYHTITEALASVPGVMVNAGYSSSGNQEIVVRGEGGKRIAVTLDGVPLADGVRGEADLSTIPLAAVETIEIHRGGTWGNAGVGGLLNINTRKIFPARRAVSMQYGSYDDWRTSATLSNSWQSKIGYLATGEVNGRGNEYTYPDRESRDTTRNNAGLQARKFFSKLGGRFASAWDWGIATLFNENDRGSPGALHTSTPFAELRERRRMITGDISASPRSIVGGSLRLSVSDYRTLYEDSVTFRSHSRFDETVYLANASVSCGPVIRSLLSLSLGGEILHRKITGLDYLVPSRSFGTAARTANAVWIQSRVRTPRQLPALTGTGQVVVGVRYDRDGQTPDYWAPRVSASWGWGEPCLVHLNARWGRSFRRPLLTSLFWKEDAFSAGNPELEPEKAREWEVGGEISPRGANLTAGVRFFDRAYDGFIEWEKRYGGSWAPINLPRATLVGREDSFAWSLPGDRLNVDFFHTLMWPINEAPDRNYHGKFLLFRPKHSYQAAVRAAFRHFQARLEARWVSERFIRKQNTKSLPAYRWFDLNVRQSFRWHRLRALWSFKVENLTNEPVELLEGYPLPGRTVSLGLEFTF